MPDIFYRAIKSQSVPVGASPVTVTPAFQHTTRLRVLATTDVYMLFEQLTSPATPSNGVYLPALSAEYLSIAPGDYLSVVAVDTTQTGTFNLTDLSK